MEDPAVDVRKGAVRDMLRFGGYKPSGRAKPASEYLLNAALKDAFPLINNIVDINNLVSLEFMLPMSLIDLDLAGTSCFAVRRGREDEAYVFNPSGQILALGDLLLTAALPDDRPCASPVKDSHATKVHAGSTRLAVIVYAPAELLKRRPRPPGARPTSSPDSARFRPRTESGENCRCLSWLRFCLTPPPS